MEKINLKLTTLNNALATLKKSIDLLNKYERLKSAISASDSEEMRLAMRDSMIQRFEYCTDLFWKVLKIYLEEVEKITVPVNSPRGVIREIVKARIITEEEGQACMEMIERRNETSHLYHQETAEKIAQKVPAFYGLLTSIINKIQARLS